MAIYSKRYYWGFKKYNSRTGLYKVRKDTVLMVQFETGKIESYMKKNLRVGSLGLKLCKVYRII